MARETCTEIFLDLLEWFTAFNKDERDVFLAGFVCGQAEKVYLGACRASMAHPYSKEEYTIVMIAAEKICARYGLELTEIDGEIWIHRRSKAVTDLLAAMAAMKKGSPQYHRARAALVGIPRGEVDARYHCRRLRERRVAVRRYLEKTTAKKTQG